MCTAFYKKKREKMGALATFGLQLGQTAIGALTGMGMARWNDKRQLEMQRKLQDMQFNDNVRMMDLQYGKQYEMWKKTNYGAQMEELKKAGLNPGLLYGMGGGGGTTTGSGGGQGVSGGSAPTGGGEMKDAMGMGIQAGMMQAQIEVMKSQAELNRAQAEKTAGVDTTKAEAETQNLMQGYDNLRNTFDLQNLDKALKNLEIRQREGTVDEIITQTETATKEALQQLQIVSNEAKESTATLEDKIKMVKAQAIGAGIENILKRENILKIQADRKAIDTQINMWIQNNMREWDKMNFEERKIRVQELTSSFATDPVNSTLDKLTRLVDNIIIMKK